MGLGRVLRASSAGPAANQLSLQLNLRRTRTQQVSRFDHVSGANSGENNPIRDAFRNRQVLREGLGPFPPPPPAGPGLQSLSHRSFYTPRQRSNPSEPALFASSHATPVSLSNTGPPVHDRDLFVSSIQSLLGGEQLTGLDQLEELMLMEAIRLSMSDIHAQSAAILEESTVPAESDLAGLNNDFFFAAESSAAAAAEVDPFHGGEREEVDSRYEVDHFEESEESGSAHFPQPLNSARSTENRMDSDVADFEDTGDDLDDEEFASYHEKRGSRSSSGDSSCSDGTSLASLPMPTRQLALDEGSASPSMKLQQQPPGDPSEASAKRNDWENDPDFKTSASKVEEEDEQEVATSLPVTRSGLYLHCRSRSETPGRACSHRSSSDTDLSSSSSLLEKIQMALDSPAASRIHLHHSNSGSPVILEDPERDSSQSKGQCGYPHRSHNSFPQLLRDAQPLQPPPTPREGEEEEGDEGQRRERRAFFIPQRERQLQDSAMDDSLSNELADDLLGDFF